MRWGATLLVLLLYTARLHAGEVVTSQVEHQGREYQMLLVARVDAPRDAVHRALTDYAHLDRVISNVEQSRIVGHDADALRLLVVSYDCILVFCKRITQVQIVTEHEDGNIDAILDPHHGDFDSGQLNWRIDADGPGTRVTLNMRFVPRFWIPPIIGPWLLKLRLRNQSEQTILNLEQLAAKS
ncbi:MAG: hypothetical protein AMJ69_01680 [Gammaproteobacteria bacterium SG8_47]|nr:MAG: hypothetical protein AMJ69_01680 [Gammaproteobacteria bacterium SG8_47]